MYTAIQCSCRTCVKEAWLLQADINDRRRAAISKVVCSFILIALVAWAAVSHG